MNQGLRVDCLMKKNQKSKSPDTLPLRPAVPTGMLMSEFTFFTLIMIPLRAAVPTRGADVWLGAVPLGAGLGPPQHQPPADRQPRLPPGTRPSDRGLPTEDATTHAAQTEPCTGYWVRRFVQFQLELSRQHKMHQI
jgi:hypothetical protein